jgi:hypothetical protein
MRTVPGLMDDGDIVVEHQDRLAQFGWKFGEA